MNAPAELSTQISTLDISLLHPSPTNPRKRFNQPKLEELAQSIRAVGVAQPLLVRVALQDDGCGAVENKGNFEIVAGERRYRAAKLAGLQEVPCFVRNLTDQQVLHIQLIENLQRDDLHPIEEAEGYERLMQELDPHGNKYTADAIAAEIGKSRSYVFARRKLLSLCQEARDAFYEGKLDASTALLIARIPVEKLQLQALKKITEECGWDNPFLSTGDKMSFRRARTMVQDEFMTRLDRAIFDQKDTELLPKAGDCISCRKRTGNEPDLFDDVDDPDVCTDPVCFAMKKTAHVLKLQKEAEAEGAEVIKGKDAKKLLKYPFNSEQQLRENGLATLDAPVPGDKDNRTLRDILDQSKVEMKRTVVANPHRDGQLIETVSIEAATKALREAGLDIRLKSETAGQNQQEFARREEFEKRRFKIENAYRARLFDAVHQKIADEMANPEQQIFAAINGMLALRMYEQASYDATDKELSIIVRKYNPDFPQTDTEDVDLTSHLNEFGEQIKYLTPQQHALLMIDLLMANDLSANGSVQPECLLEIAGLCGIDPEQINREVNAEMRANDKKSATPPVEKPPVENELKTKKLGAVPNEHGVYICDPDEVIKWAYQKNQVRIELIELANGKWVYAISTRFGDSATLEGISKHNLTDSRKETLKKAFLYLENYNSSNLKGKALTGFKSFVNGLSLEAAKKAEETTNDNSATLQAKPRPAAIPRPAATWPFPTPLDKKGGGAA